MSPREPVDPRVRLAITQWPPDAPRGAVNTFRAEHGISRKTFYEIRKRAVTPGAARQEHTTSRLGGDTEGSTPAAKPTAACWLGRHSQHPSRRQRHSPGAPNPVPCHSVLAGQTVYFLETNDHPLIFNERGTEIMKYRWPGPGTKYVGSGKSRGRPFRTL